MSSALSLNNPVNIPRLAPIQKWRTPKKNIPQTLAERTRILQTVRNYVAEYNPVPPLPVPELKLHADRLVEQLGCDPIYRDYIGGARLSPRFPTNAACSCSRNVCAWKANVPLPSMSLDCSASNAAFARFRT